MSEQKENEKFILDAAAGFRMMWFDKSQPNTIYLDNRPECNPDVIGDFRNLEQFKDDTFTLIVWDPPHEVRWKSSDPNCHFVHDFGWLQTETWASDLSKGARECFRVLKPRGVLIFKWNTKTIKVESVLSLFPQRPLFGQVTKGEIGSRKHASKTYWFCFMKFSTPGYNAPQTV